MELALKRVIDVVGAGVVLVLVSPLLLAAYLLILLVDGRPVMYRQQRGGLHGREFTMLKFRTMVNGAHETRADLLDNNERSGPVFKIANDPRITRLGRVMRKTSMDEAPQLFNVLLGQMSLVGPRPQPLEEVAEYDLWHRRRLSMRPGITGLWQIRARHDPSFDTWMDNDLEYIDRWSLWLDLMVLVRTPAALIRTPGT
jgi:lipopolysaccharide/colanic/teichoic acid biosynthesis glycosyltransferase